MRLDLIRCMQLMLARFRKCTNDIARERERETRRRPRNIFVSNTLKYLARNRPSRWMMQRRPVVSVETGTHHRTRS